MSAVLRECCEYSKDVVSKRRYLFLVPHFQSPPQIKPPHSPLPQSMTSDYYKRDVSATVWLQIKDLQKPSFLTLGAAA